MPKLIPFLVVMVIAQSLMGMCFNAAGVLAPVAAPALGFSPAALGPYVGASGVASLAGGMFIDGILRRYGAARTLQISMLVCATGVLFAASANLPLVLLSSLVVGVGGGMMVPCAIHLVARVTPPERAGMVFAINQCGIPAGFGLAGIVFPLLLRVTDWRMSLVLLAAALLLMIPLIQPMRRALDSDRDAAAPLGGKALIAPLRLAWSVPNLRLLGWLAFSFMTVQMAFVSYLVSYVKIDLQFSHVEAGAALLVSQVAAILSRLFFGWLLDRVGRHFLVLGILGSGSGLAAFVLGLANPHWTYSAVVLIAGLSGAFVMGWNAVYFAAVARMAPEGRSGTAVGGTQIFTAAGSVVGPLVFAGVLGAGGGYGAGFVATSAFALVMGARLLWIDRTVASGGWKR